MSDTATAVIPAVAANRRRGLMWCVGRCRRQPAGSERREDVRQVGSTRTPPSPTIATLRSRATLLVMLGSRCGAVVHTLNTRQPAPARRSPAAYTPSAPLMASHLPELNQSASAYAPSAQPLVVIVDARRLSLGRRAQVVLLHLAQ